MINSPLSSRPKRGTSGVEGSRVRYPRPRSLDFVRKLTPLGMTGMLPAWGLLAPGVVVEAAPALPAEEAGRHHLLQQRRRGVLRLVHLLVQDAGDVVGRVQTDEVQQ